VCSIRFEKIARGVRGDALPSTVFNYRLVTFLRLVIILKVAEPVVGIRNVISILFQQQYDISKGWDGGSRLKSV
jgi:hypothetical protein